MYDILNRTMEYLEDNNKPEYRAITYLDIAETIVPKTNEPIKKFFLRQNHILKTSSNLNLLSINFIKGFPIIYNPDIYKKETLDHFHSYFTSEKECLSLIKKALKDKNNHLLTEDFSTNACCGVIMEAVHNIQKDNCSKLATVIRHYNTRARGINVSFDEEALLPNNEKLITDTAKTLKKIIYKK